MTWVEAKRGEFFIPYPRSPIHPLVLALFLPWRFKFLLHGSELTTEAQRSRRDAKQNCGLKRNAETRRSQREARRGFDLPSPIHLLNLALFLPWRFKFLLHGSELTTEAQRSRRDAKQNCGLKRNAETRRSQREARRGFDLPSPIHLLNLALLATWRFKFLLHGSELTTEAQRSRSRIVA
jgi:hypothetical protein